MRELKFRAWDDGKMYYSDDDLNLEIFFMTFDGDYNKSSRMQFTGLKDKNCKEIYEGDIIQLTPRTKDVVKWNEYDTGFIPFADGWASVAATGTEVIGNIYENPELCSHNTGKVTK